MKQKWGISTSVNNDISSSKGKNDNSIKKSSNIKDSGNGKKPGGNNSEFVAFD